MADDSAGWASHEDWLWTSAVTLVAMVVLGMTYWTQPYADLDVGALWSPLLIVAMTPVVLLRASGVASFLLAAGAGAASVVGVVAARIAVDVALDPTSHNLWPFEIVSAGFLGTLLGATAAAIGELALRFRRV